MLKKIAIVLGALFGICVLIGIIANATGSGTKSAATPQVTTVAKAQQVSQVTPTLPAKATTAPTVAATTVTTAAPKPTDIPPTRPATIAPTATTAPSPMTARPGALQFVEAKVVRVIDGDTIEVEIDGQKQTLRYIGIDTPETVDPRRPVGYYGAEASAKNKELVEGKTVRLEKDVSESDRYGRLLRYVYVGEMMVNAELVRQGYAQASAYPPDVKYQDKFRELEREAREAGRGLWAASPELTPTRTAAPAKPTATTAAAKPVATATAVAKPAATPVPPPAPSSGFDPKAYIGQGDKYNCSHFKSQADAQAVLRADPADPNRLDGSDNDGIACETRPGPYDRVPVAR